MLLKIYGLQKLVRVALPAFSDTMAIALRKNSRFACKMENARISTTKQKSYISTFCNFASVTGLLDSTKTFNI